MDRQSEDVFHACAAILSVEDPRLPKPTVVHGYLQSQLPQLVGLTRRQIRHLLDRDLVTPSVRAAGGRGRAALYGWEDLLVMATLREMLELSGAELVSRRAMTVIEAMHGISQHPIAYHCLVVDKERTYVVEDARLAMNQVEAGKPMILIPLKPVESELEGRLLQEGLPAAPAEERQRAA